MTAVCRSSTEEVLVVNVPPDTLSACETFRFVPDTSSCPELLRVAPAAKLRVPPVEVMEPVAS